MVVVIVLQEGAHADGQVGVAVTVEVVGHHGLDVGRVTVTVLSVHADSNGQWNVSEAGISGQPMNGVVVAVKQLVGEGPTHLSDTTLVVTYTCQFS